MGKEPPLSDDLRRIPGYPIVVKPDDLIKGVSMEGRRTVLIDPDWVVRIVIVVILVVIWYYWGR